MSIPWNNTSVFPYVCFRVVGQTERTIVYLNMETNRSQYFRNINDIKLCNLTFFSNTSISQLTTTRTFLSYKYVIPITNKILRKSKPTLQNDSHWFCVYFISIIYINIYIYISHIARK